MEMVNNQIQKQTGSKNLSFKGIVQVFYNPVEFFKELKDSPKILIPYITVVLIGAVFFLLIGDLMIKMQLENPEFAAQFGGQAPPPQAIQMMKTFSVLFATLSYACVPIIIATLGIFFGNFVMGGKAKFKQVLSVALYGEILFMIGALLVAPMMLAKGTMMVSLSPAVLVADQGLQSFAFQALNKLSVFHIWEFFVVGVGLAIIYNFPRNKGYILSVLSVGLIAIIHALTTLGMELFR